MESTGTSRRRFLGTAAGATGVALGAAIWGAGKVAAAVDPDAPRADGNPVSGRSYSAGKFMLAIDNVDVGWLQDVEGGHAVAEVVNEKVGADGVVRKHIAGVKYEDISMQIGFSMSKAVYDWIAASWSMESLRKDGEIVAADYNSRPLATRKFYGALITETTIPACDGSSKEPAYLTIRFSPAYTQVAPPNATLALPTVARGRQKQWLPSNFRLQIDGLDTSRVAKIDAFTLKQKVVENPIGEQRDYEREPGTVEVPNLVVTIAQSSAQTWYDWHEDFVIRGNNDQGREKTGSLTFFTSDLKGELLRIDFVGLGIFAASDDTLDTDDSPGKVSFSLYCERMAFTYLGGGSAPTPSPTPSPPPSG